MGFEPAGGLMRVVIDGQERLVDARAFDGYFYSLVIDNHSFEATVEENEDGFMVQLGIDSILVLKLDPLRPERQGPAGGSAGPTRVRSVMPGKVVRVSVAEGDSVEAGQSLMVVEAMKMENDVLAPRAGRVARVRVAPGATVEGGADLILLE